MPRHLEFDRDQALDRAIDVFWEKGYEATSIDDLQHRMGIARASLYNTFGDKKALFLKALERYQALHGSALKLLQQPDSGLDTIRRVFQLTALESAADPRGCLVINTAVRACDPEIIAFCHNSAAAGEQGFLQALRNAQAAGELPESADPVVLSRYLLNAFLGLRTLAHTKPCPEVVRDIVETTLSVLR
jgi:TetR/AcrR family transcriptional repressor of nem operon